MTHSRAWHNSFIHVTWLIHVSDIFACVTGFSHVCAMIRWCVWHVLFMRVIRLFHMCDMSHPCDWHNVWDVALICVTWFIHYYIFSYLTWLILMRDMTHLCVWNNSLTCVTWLLTSDLTHSYVWHDVWHDTLICVTWFIHHYIFAYLTWLIHMCLMARVHTRDTTNWYVWYEFSVITD